MKREKIIEYVRYLVEKDIEGYCLCEELDIYCEQFEHKKDGICEIPCNECFECWERLVNKVVEVIINGG